MSIFLGIKINDLLQHWPKGTVATSAWLKEQSINSLLKQKYEQTQ